jgi:hypothetical protein
MTSFGDNPDYNPDYTPSSWGRRKDGQAYIKKGNGSGSSGISGNNNSVEGSVIKKLPDLDWKGYTIESPSERVQTYDLPNRLSPNEIYRQFKKLPDLNQPIPEGMGKAGTPSPTMKKYEERTVEKGFIPIAKAWGLPINFPDTFEEALAFAHHPDTKGLKVVKGKDGKDMINIDGYNYKKDTLAGYAPKFHPETGETHGKKFAQWKRLTASAKLNGIPQSTVNKTIFPKQSWKCAFVLWQLPKKLDW